MTASQRDKLLVRILRLMSLCSQHKDRHTLATHAEGLLLAYKYCDYNLEGIRLTDMSYYMPIEPGSTPAKTGRLQGDYTALEDPNVFK